MRRIAAAWIVFAVGCGSSSEIRPAAEKAREPTAEELREVLLGWDVNLCTLLPRELLLAERAYLRRAEVADDEVAARTRAKFAAIEKFVAEWNRRKGKNETLSSYLAGVDATEDGYRKIAAREARVEAIAARVLRSEDWNRSSAPTDAEVVGAIRRTIEVGAKVR